MRISTSLAAYAFADARVSVRSHLTSVPRPVREPAVSRLVLDLREAAERRERRLTLV